jgi:hypothetical protein
MLAEKPCDMAPTELWAANPVFGVRARHHDASQSPDYLGPRETIYGLATVPTYYMAEDGYELDTTKRIFWKQEKRPATAWGLDRGR